MNKIFACTLGLVLLAGTVFADSYSVTVGTNSVRILPSRTLDGAATWTTNTVYAQGTYVQVSRHRFYMAITGGVSGTGSGPSHSQGIKPEGTVSWLAVNRTDRLEATISNDSAAVIYLSDTSPAEVGRGYRMNAFGGLYNYAGSGDIFAIADGGTNNNAAVIDP